MQSTPNLRWDDLRVFLALHRRGSLVRGAEELGVNISTMSRRLDALEDATGVTLFDRTPEGTKPTAAGEQLLPFAETMEHGAFGFTRGVESLEAEVVGDVRITAPPGLVDHFLARALPDLCAKHPRLRVTVLSTIGYADLTRHEADIALRILRPAAGDLVSTRVSSQGWCIVASPELARRHKNLVDPNAERWTTWGDDLARQPDRVWVTKHVAPENIALLTSSMTAQIEAVRAGLGLMIAPPVYGDLPGLCRVKVHRSLRESLDALPDVALWLVGHRALRDVPRISAVWEWLRDQFRAL